jgi:2,4-dienoyl-CoA reductase-like NADH-dependent reductase (Old Yellow Enzyme family)
MPNDWHLVHLGSRAVGGAGLVFTEATAVSPEGRISPDDAGIWNDEQANAYKGITSFIKSQNSVPGIQLAHAGRKASTFSPWKGSGEVTPEKGGWQTIAPSAGPFSDKYPSPREMSVEDIKLVIDQFCQAAKRSLNAGFEIIELHFAHGYLGHEFLSPISNKRTDNYGGSIENRCRFAIEITKAVRKIIPDSMPLFVRISASDWTDEGWDVDQSEQLAKWLKDVGIDLIDCSSGGNVLNAKIPLKPGYQIPFAQRIKKEANILTGGVGLITTAEQAEQIISEGQADIVLLAREMLRDPYWPMHAAKKLNVEITDFPNQYLRAK